MDLTLLIWCRLGLVSYPQCRQHVHPQRHAGYTPVYSRHVSSFPVVVSRPQTQARYSSPSLYPLHVHSKQLVAALTNTHSCFVTDHTQKQTFYRRIIRRRRKPRSTTSRSNRDKTKRSKSRIKPSLSAGTPLKSSGHHRWTSWVIFFIPIMCWRSRQTTTAEDNLSAEGSGCVLSHVIHRRAIWCRVEPSVFVG